MSRRLNPKTALIVAAILRGAVSVADAAPAITSVTTDYTDGGGPLDINIVGPGFVRDHAQRQVIALEIAVIAFPPYTHSNMLRRTQPLRSKCMT